MINGGYYLQALKNSKSERIIFYHTMVSVNESYYPILTANQNPTPVTLQKGFLRHKFTPILEKRKIHQPFMINRPLQIAEFLIEKCQFPNIEEIFENSIEDNRIIEKILAIVKKLVGKRSLL